MLVPLSFIPLGTCRGPKLDPTREVHFAVTSVKHTAQIRIIVIACSTYLKAHTFSRDI